MTVQDPMTGVSHLGYELSQMVNAAGMITPEVVAAGVDTGTVQNAMIESTLIHARALIEFLLDRRRYADDIRPEDLCAGWDGPDEVTRARLDADRKLLHKHLVHLTWERVAEPPEPWAYLDTVQLILRQLESFDDHMRTVLDQGGDVSPDVIRLMSARLLWARQSVAEWSPQARLVASAPSTTTYDTYIIVDSGGSSRSAQ